MAWYRRRRRYRRYSRPRYINPRISAIKSLADNPIQFYSTIFAIGSIYISYPGRLRELIKYSPDHILASSEFHHRVGEVLLDFMDQNVSEKRRYSAYGSEYPYLIQYCMKYIDKDTKSGIVDRTIKYGKNFSSQARKELANISVGFLEPGDLRALNILRDFHRVIKLPDFDSLIDKIPNGLQNPEVKKILSRTKMFKYLKYDEEKVNSDFNEKVKLVKDIAETPTLIKRLQFDLNIGLEHLKKIPPARRFKFVQYIFRHQIQKSRYGWNTGEVLERAFTIAKRKAKEDRLTVVRIDLEDMKELLFSVSLQKNEEFSKWINLYRLYLDCLDAPSRSRIDTAKYR